MEYRLLGRTGPHVSVLCLGTMTFGSSTEEAVAARIIGIARDAGVTFIDTADAYAGGAGEQMVGRLLEGDRDRWVLATKVGAPVSAEPDDRGLRRRHVIRAVHTSLRHLRTDRIDLLYLHVDDLDVSPHDILSTLGDLMAAGDILQYGVSNFRAWRVAALVEAARALGMPVPVALQPCYNAMNRQPEVELLPMAGHYGLGVVPYSPLARGVLTGKYAPNTPPDPDTRAGRADRRMLEAEWRPESLRHAQAMRSHAETKGRSASDLAISWLLHHPLVSSVLAGPRTISQWEAYLTALDYPFDAGDEALVDSLVPAGYASTYGYHDPAYPLARRSSLSST